MRFCSQSVKSKLAMKSNILVLVALVSAAAARELKA
jgi:hypothetical protein